MGDAAMRAPITLFACPKAFAGEFTRIQTNAIGSWKALDVEEIALLGDDAGVEDFCQREQVTWGGVVERNAYGTPLLHEVFELGEQIAQTELVCYINADIILFESFMSAVEACAEALPQFLMSGQRSDVDDVPAIRFDGGLVAPAMQHWLKSRGKLIGAQAMDYFAYRKGDLGEIPPYALGRNRWDNALLARALNRELALVDATEAVFAAHQNHSKSQPFGEVELHANDALVGANEGWLGRLTDATHTISADFQINERMKL